jgi:hypothetical protein
MIELGIKLVLAHILGDFVLQPFSWVKDKEARGIRAKGLYNHIMVHVLMMYVVLWFDSRYWQAFLVIPITHFAIDLLKVYLKGKLNSRFLFIADQVLHFLVIFGVVLFFFPGKFKWDYLQNPKVLLTITALLMVTFASGILLKTLLSRWNVETHEENKYRGMEEAGKYIGMLERLFIFLFVVIGQWAGLGFLITAKSIFRFNDLSRNHDRQFTEYILIGTLMSFGIAITIGLIYKYLLGLL